MSNISLFKLDYEIRKLLDSRGITKNSTNDDLHRVSYENSVAEYTFFIDNIITIVENRKKINIMDDYKNHPRIYHSYLMEIVGDTVINFMKVNKIHVFYLIFKLNTYVEMGRIGIAFNKKFTDFTTSNSLTEDNYI